MKRFSIALAVLAGIVFTAAAALAQNPAQRLELDRRGETIVLEPYAPNILRVTLSLQREPAQAAPGYGFVAAPNGEGWSSARTEQSDVYRSARIVATVEREHSSSRPPDPNQAALGKYFSGSAPGAHITFTTPEGKKLLEMTGWEQAILNQKDGTAEPLHDRRATDPEFFTVGASFVSPEDEHYYGLGQNQEGFLDHRGHVVRCWHDYLASAGQSVCVPFMVTNKGYGLVWDNPSKTTIEPGFNEQTRANAAQGRLRLHPVQAALQ
jgi:alpha-D-xyloside xylohydrolase